MSWDVELRGGAYDGFAGKADQVPEAVIVAWKCSPLCDGHATFDAHNPAIVLRTAETYRRVEIDPDARLAVYEVGESSSGPSVEEHELVGVGA